jgi:heme-degrading monooxygenase HmoA
MDLDQQVIWITIRRLKPGTRREFSEAWRPREFPDGMLRAYECDAIGGDEVVGISVWESAEARDRYRLSDVEAQRCTAMAPFILEQTSGVYTGRELTIPGR